MERLLNRGYVGATFEVEPRMRSSLQSIVNTALQQKHKQKYMDGRVGYPIPPAQISTVQWKAIFPEDRVQILQEYLGGDPELLRGEVLEVPPNAVRQKIHRDHDIGARKSLCVAVNLQAGQSVGTLFLPGSHLTEDVASDGDPVVSSRGDWIAYDTYAIHAGAGNPSNQSISGRLFFTFRAPASTLSRLEKSHLTRALAQKTTSLHGPIPLSDLTNGTLGGKRKAVVSGSSKDSKRREPL